MPARDLVSIPTFKAVLWLSVGLMTVAFTARAYIRIACFRRLFIEDWFMLVALCMFIADSVLGTIYMRPLYDLVHLADGSFVPGPHFKEHTVMALRGFTGTAVLTNLGIFIIKLNFLLFFYRFGHQLPKFRALWWLVFVIVLASGAVQIGIIQFDCMLSDINTILITCSSSSHLRRNRQLFIVSVTLDIFTNFLIICFPVSIFWSSRLSLRQKLVLSAIFSLAGFTIVVTVFRGGFSLNTNEYPAVAGLSVAYNFWITLEYLVSFLIACIVSFRSLFIQKRNKTELQARREAERLRIRTSNRERDSGGWRRRIQELHDTLLDTCRELEGFDTENEMSNLPMPASGLMTVDFSSGEVASDWTAASNTADKNSHTSTPASHDDSVDPLRPKNYTASPV